MKTILSTFILMLVSACATVPGFIASPPPDEGQALVYIYWLPSFTTTELTPMVLINGEKYQNIRNGGYMFSYLKEGEYKIGLQFGFRQLNSAFRIISGETYFIKVTSGIRPVGHSYSLANFGVEAIDSVMGSQEITETTLISELKINEDRLD